MAGFESHAAGGAERPTPELPQRRPRGLTVRSAEHALSCRSCEADSDLLLDTRAGALCLDCAGLGHLVFLPAGDAALTRRATTGSRWSVAVVRWNSRRNRYERQGVLTEANAIESAARQCLDEAGERAMRPASADEQVRGDVADAIRAHFPGCPAARAEAIAYHATVRGRGRRVARRSWDADAIGLAVAASVRHIDTDYDDLLLSGIGPEDARQRVRPRVDDILTAWRDGVAVLDT